MKYLLSIFVSLYAFLLNGSFVLAEETEKERVITPEELRVANGVDTEKLWLSMLGRVFDVSASPHFYGTEGHYHIFVGRDAPAPFITGVFTEEEAAKKWSDLEDKQLYGLGQWITFYENDSKYPFVGLLEGDFYDKEGNPTEERGRLQAVLDEQEARMQKIMKERDEKIAKRQKKANSKMASTEL